MKEKRQRQPSVLVIHGPNLNMLGRREPGIYGHSTLGDIDDRLVEVGKRLKIAVETFQSNHEGEIVEKIQAATGYDGLIIRGKAAILILTVVGCDQGIFCNFKKFTVIIAKRACEPVDYRWFFGSHGYSFRNAII